MKRGRLFQPSFTRQRRKKRVPAKASRNPNPAKPSPTTRSRRTKVRSLMQKSWTRRRKSRKAASSSPIPPRKKPTEGLIVALGTGKTDDNGKKVPFEVKKGDRVLISKYGGTEIKLNGKEYKILNSDDILAVVE